MIVRGIQNQLITEIGDVEFNADGSASGVIKYRISPYSEAFNKAPKVREDRHPAFPRLLAQKVVIAYLKPNVAEVTVTYEGAAGSTETVTIGGNAGAVTEIEVTPSLQESPIELHEKFPQLREYAKFDDDGNFSGWKFTPDSENEALFQGVKSFLSPTVTLRRSYTTKTRPDMSKLREIFDDVTGAPEVGENQNWMLMSMPYRDYGTGEYSVTEEYLLSGKNGWNSILYGDESI